MREFCLTEQEKNELCVTHGYLAIPDALSPEQVERLSEAVDRHAPKFANPSFPYQNVVDILGMDDAFLDLVDHEKVLPKICGLLGWNIWVHQSHFNVNPPVDDKVYTNRNGRFLYVWHRDGGAIHRDITAAPSLPRLTVKVGYYLTDITEDCGPTLVVRGSHLSGEVLKLDALPPPQAKPLLLRKGTAVIYDSRLVHSLRSPNRSGITRKAVFLQYAYRWIEPVDGMTVEHLAARCSPIRRQLLGLSTTYMECNASRGRSGRFYPSDDDVPLRRHLAELLGDEAPKYVSRSVHEGELRRNID